jgi:predicted aminopeptidase
VREAKKATAARVLSFRVHVVGSHGPDSTYSSRDAAEEEAGRLRRSGLEIVVQPVHAPLPTNPWLCIHT